MGGLQIVYLLVFAAAMVLVWWLLQFSIALWGRSEAAFSHSIESRLSGLFLFADIKKVFIIYASIIILVPLLLYLLGVHLIVVVLTAGVLLISPRLVFVQLEKQRRKVIGASLPDTLLQMAAAMKAGATLNSAIEAMVAENPGPIAQEFSLLLREQKLGKRFAEALDNLAERVQSEEMDLVVSAALIAQDVGGNLAEVFQRLSETLRRKLEMEGKIRALTAQGVLQGWVVSLLPFGILLMISFVEPEAVRSMFQSVLGWAFLALIIVLELLGGLMIRKIVTIPI